MQRISFLGIRLRVSHHQLRLKVYATTPQYFPLNQDILPIQDSIRYNAFRHLVRIRGQYVYNWRELFVEYIYQN